MDTKIYFSIPDFWKKFNFNLIFLNLYNSERDKFYDDVIIDNIYGNFPCIWNGGRILEGQTNGLNIINTITPFNDMGIGIRLTCTNSLIEEKHLSDTLGNQILKLCENKLNSVNVCSSLMKEYIEKNFPQYSVLWSTTLWETNIDTINQLSKDNILVLDYSLNNQFNKLSQLKYPEHIEILCSEVCIDNCPFRKEHYIAISQYNMNEPVEEYSCNTPRPIQPYYDTIYNNHSYVDIDLIRNKYLPLGINKFKINGRGENVINVLERYINYFVKPQYKDEIRNKLLLQLYN